MRASTRRCALSFSLTLALAAGCASGGAPDEREPPAPVRESSSAAVAPDAPAESSGAGRLVVPVTYTGRLPCADCPGIQLTLTLLADSTFRLRQVYQDRPAVFHDLGRWSVEGNGARLVLRSGGEAAQRFQIIGSDSLRLLDMQDQPTGSQPQYVLARAPRLDPVRDTMQLRGVYSYMADAGRFTECRSGTAFPVAQVGAHAALERAYLAARTGPGAPLVVGIRGHFEERRGMEGDRLLEHVVVDSVERVGPGATCEEGRSNATVANTYWKLIEVGGRSVRVPQHIAEPNLRLDPVEKRASGSTGCNRFFGGYQLSGDSLRFDALGSTRRACLDPVQNAQETAFLEALADTRTWQVTGDTLVLSGEVGPVARFAARYME